MWFGDAVWLFSDLLVLPLLADTADGKLYCLGSLGIIPESTNKGLLYIFIAAILLLSLWELNRIKPGNPKRARK